MTNQNGCNQAPMTKEEKRLRISAIERELSDIKDKEATIASVRGELSRPDRTLGIKLFTGICNSDEDYHGKQVWVESPSFLKPTVILSFYEAELKERTEVLTKELNALIA